MKHRLIFMAVVLALLMLCGCEETPVEVITVGQIHTAATGRELYDLFAADADTSYIDGTGRPGRENDGTAVFQNGESLPVEGFEEQQMVRSDGEYLYILDAGDLKIVRMNGGESTLLSTTGVWEEENEDRYETARGLYVSGTTVGVLIDAEVFGDSATVSTYTDQCTLRLYDVSDPENPKRYAELAQDGYLMDSRMHNGVVYLVSTDYKLAPDDGEKASYLPAVSNNGKGEMLALDHIFICPAPSARAYTVVSAIDLESAERLDACAFTSESSSAYMNEHGLYLARTVTETQTKEPTTEDGLTVTESVQSSNTELKRIQLVEKKLTLTEMTQVSGKILNRYAMDFSQNALRVLTADDSKRTKTYEGENAPEPTTQEHLAETNVFTLQEDLQPMASLSGIAEGQNIYSARLIDDVAYLITYNRQAPLVAIDLSDPKAPQLLENTGAAGTAGYLHRFDKDSLFGLGLSEQYQLQAEILDVSDPNDITLESQLELPYSWSEALYNPKAALMDAQKELLGFPAEKVYVLLELDGKELKERGAVDFPYYSQNTRAIVQDDMLYLCDPQALVVAELDTLTIQKTITFGAG